MKTLFCLLTVVAFILSCNGHKKMVAEESSINDGRLTLIATDNYSGADSTETLVITDAKALQLFYSRVNRTRKPGLPVPDIDFSRNVVVILCSADEGYSDPQRLVVLEETDDEMILGMPKRAGNRGHASDMDNEPRVSPFFVYKLPLTEKKISFDKMK